METVDDAMEELKRSRDQLRRSRNALADVRAQLTERKAIADEAFLNANAGLMVLSQELQAEVALAEKEAREHINQWFIATGDKKPLPGFGGKTVTEAIVTDEVKAFAWALEHRMCLTVDEKALIKVAKATPDALKDIVTFTERFRPEISPNLEPLEEE